MSWKKNTFSYLLWFLHSIAAVALVTFEAFNIFHKEWYKAAIAGAALFGAAALLVFLLHKATMKLWNKGLFRKKHELLLWESLWVVLVFAIGIVFFANGLPGAAKESVYFEAAKVAEGQTVPSVVHGAEYLYLQLLHLVFLVFGNKMFAGILLQVVLEFAGFLLMYFGVRKLAGRIPAMAAVAFLPFVAEDLLTLSYTSLFFFLFTLCFWYVSYLADHKNYVLFFLAGAMCGFLCYLDVWGSLLLVFAFCMPFADKKPTEEDLFLEKPTQKTFWEKLLLLLISIFACVAVFTGIIFADAFLSGKPTENVLGAWCQLYKPQLLSFDAFPMSGFMSSAAVLVCFTVGIFSFFCRKKKEVFRVWHLAFLWYCIVSGTGILLQVAEEDSLFTIIFIVLAALSIREIFALPNTFSEPTVLQQEDAAQVSFEPMSKESEGDLEILELPEEEKAEREETKEPERKINYIENPLPLPKKHEKKVMDYSLTDSESDGFDLDFDENDDFDI